MIRVDLVYSPDDAGYYLDVWKDGVYSQLPASGVWKQESTALRHKRRIDRANRAKVVS